MKELQGSSQLALDNRIISDRVQTWIPLPEDREDYGRLRAPGLEVTGRDLNTFSTPVRGKLTVVESGKDIPFQIVRIFYIYGATTDCERGAHAHRATWQSFIAVSGSFVLELTDGHFQNTYLLENASRVINVPPMIWARLCGFSKDAVCLVLASSLYDSADYIREWEDYLALVRSDSTRTR